MNAPWLFAEAYKYRRLRECFSVSKYWKVSMPHVPKYCQLDFLLGLRRILPSKMRLILTIL